MTRAMITRISIYFSLNKIVKIFIGRIWTKNILTPELKDYIIRCAMQHKYLHDKPYY